MKVLSTDGLTKLIQLIKSSFISVNNTVSANSIELATVATSGNYNDLTNKPAIPDAVTESIVSGWGFTKNTGTVTSVNNVQPVNGNVDIFFRNIGEIVTSTIPLTDAGLHLLDGALIDGNGVYSAFVDYIANLYGDGSNVPGYFTDETTWQSTVNTYGVCGKFVYDRTNNTVRLPKYSNKIYTQEIDATAPVVGNGLTLGLTDGTNNVGLAQSGRTNVDYNRLYGNTSHYGVNISSTGYINTGGNTEGLYGVTSDPTKSGIIAQLSDITTSLDGYYYIVIATSTKTDIQVDIDNIATDLNNKADTDLSNITDTGYIKMAGAGMPSDKYIDLTLGASGSTYTAPADGWFALNKQAGNPGFNPFIAMINTTAGRLSTESRPGGQGIVTINLFLPAKKGDVIEVYYDATGTTNYFRFVYAQGSESEAS